MAPTHWIGLESGYYDWLPKPILIPTFCTGGSGSGGSSGGGDNGGGGIGCGDSGSGGSAAAGAN